nr:MAG TPA: lipoprotein [Caudoviricetes sp.]
MPLDPAVGLIWALTGCVRMCRPGAHSRSDCCEY